MLGYSKLVLKRASAKKPISYGGEAQDASTPLLRRDFRDAQVTELLGKLRKGTIMKREGERTNVLQRTHIGRGSGSDGRSVSVLTAQIHGAHRIYSCSRTRQQRRMEQLRSHRRQHHYFLPLRGVRWPPSTINALPAL